MNFLQLVLFLTNLLLIVAAAESTNTAHQSHDDFTNPFKIIGIFSGFGNHGQGGKVAPEPQTMMVIGAGLGRTGTSSFIKASEMLGLKSYHMKAVMETPGHSELWSRHAQLIEEGKDGISELIIDSMLAAGYNSTSSMPSCFLYKDLLKRYPNAKVVMTVRSDGNGDAWAKSVLGSVGQMGLMLHRVPFRWVTKYQHMKVFVPWMFKRIGAPFDPVSRMPKSEDLAKSYELWVEEVKASVPEENLLLLEAKNGWGPLCDFVSPIDPSIEERCNEILSSGIPYPRVNDKAFVQRIVTIMNAIATFVESLPFVLVGLCLALYLWSTRRRNRRSSVAAAKQKGI